MAYNNFYPNLNPVYFPQYQQAQQNQQNTQQVQNGGFISVKSEEEARAYPVAPGTSVTFRDESSSHIYTKTMGFSQLDQPVFQKFRLVKEDSEEKPVENVDYVQKSEFENAAADFIHKNEFESLKKEIEKLKKQIGEKKGKLTDD